MGLIEITKNISYLPASENPLSSDVVFITKENKTYIFDVGANDEAAELINGIADEKIVVISHFHQDHAANVGRIKFDQLYASKETIKHTHTGSVISDTVVFDDDITALTVPSSHAKGCVIVVCGDFAFLGDCAYAGFKHGKRLYNVYQLGQLIKLLEGLDVKYFGMSHYKNFIYEKETVLTMLGEQYAKRTAGCDFIEAIGRRKD